MRSRSGFTLLEIMMVLALIAIIFIGSAPLIVASGTERRMRAAAEQIEGMVRAERHDVLSSGERRVVEIRPAGFYEKGLKLREVLPMPKDLAVTFRAPGESQWGKASGQEWEFSPIGMVTPLSVRLQSGDYWMELDFDMLTGRLAEERYAF